MELANCRLHIGNDSDVPLRSITPAEAMVLVALHKDRAKKHPLLDLKVTGTAQSIKDAAVVQDGDQTYDEDQTIPDPKDPLKTIVVPKGAIIRNGTTLKSATYRPRTGLEELSRLKTKYHATTLKELFPKGAVVPETFTAAAETWKEIPKVADEETVGSWTDTPGPLPKQDSAPLNKPNPSKQPDPALAPK